MARVRLEKTRDWELVHDEQDIRGRDVWDEAGHKLGTVEDLIVDTDEERVVAAVLDTGREVPARDLTIAEDAVYLLAPGPAAPPASAEAPPVAGTPAPAFAATSQPRVPPQGHTSYDEYSRLRRREQFEEAPPPPPRPAAEAPPPPPRASAPPAPRAREGSAFVDYSDYADDFHRHYDDTYGHLQRRYTDFEPAYRFGYDMAYDERFEDRDFAEVEADLRQAYYRRHGYPMSDPHVWNDVREAVHHAFSRARR